VLLVLIGLFLEAKNTKAPGGTNYPCGGFEQALSAYLFSWLYSPLRLSVKI